LAAYRDWQRWSDSVSPTAGKGRDRALHALLEICAPELAEALTEGGVQDQEITHETGFILWHFVAWPGISDTVHTLADESGRDILQYARACFSKALAKVRARARRKVREAPPAQVLDVALELPRQRAARVLKLLSRGHQREVARIAIERLAADSRAEQVVCRLEDQYEPENALQWIVWYLGGQHAAASFEEGVLGRGEGCPRPTVIVFGLWDDHGRAKSPPESEGGRLPNLAGPINTRVWLAIESEMTRRRLPIRDPGSLSRIERRSGFSRDRIRRWRGDPRSLSLGEITPDGRGGVYAKLTLEDAVRSIEIFEGGKPGPKPHPTAE